jgi:hypothetical protein
MNLFGGACLLALLSVAGCASVPYRTHPELLRAKNSIRTVGIMPVTVAGFVEQFSFTDSLVPREDMSKQMSETVTAALREEMAAQQVQSVVIGNEDQDLADLADLYSAIDYTVARHFLPMTMYRWEDEYIEPFPPEGRPFEFSAGQAKVAMERLGVDAVWFLSGFNLIPTTGARVQDVVGFLIALAGSYGSGSGPHILVNFELRGALVARDGTLLFYGKVTEGNILGGDDAGSAALDLRDAEFARRCIRSLLAQYRQAVRE